MNSMDVWEEENEIRVCGQTFLYFSNCWGMASAPLKDLRRYAQPRRFVTRSATRRARCGGLLLAVAAAAGLVAPNRRGRAQHHRRNIGTLLLLGSCA